MTPGRKQTPQRGWPIALAGLVALAVVMGIGRFAFTPLMPMMLGEHLLDLPAAGWLASINYLGYLTGGLVCMLQPWVAARLKCSTQVDAPRVVRAGLVATALLTVAMAWHWTAAWPTLRFAAGFGSAVVFVYTSGWCLARLATLNAGNLGGVIYAGPGAGIIVSGLSAGAMVVAGWTASVAWLIFGTLAMALTATVWRVFRTPPAAEQDAADSTVAVASSAPASADGAGPVAVHTRTELVLLVVAYGLAGFGYIITATFLPVIARQALPESAWIDLFWPLFGVGVVAGALIASRLPVAGDRRVRLSTAYVMQAAGVLVSLFWPSLPGFIAGSVLLGLPFTAITFFVMQEVRRLRPATVASAMGLATVFYGVGQIVGPVLVTFLLRHSTTPREGFDRALGVAASALLVGLAVYLVSMRVFPLRTEPSGRSA